MVHGGNKPDGRATPLLIVARLFCVLFVLHTNRTSSAADSESNRTNVLLIVADDLRADVMSVYGGPATTPHLQRLADRGSTFFRATCGYPICHVSRSEILTGRFLVAAGSSGRSIPFDKSWTLLPQTLNAAGWHTIHSGKWHVAGTPATCGYAETTALYSPSAIPASDLTYPKSATDRDVTGYVGWTFKSDDGQTENEGGVGLTPQTDVRIADAAAEAIRRRRPKPLFLHVNFTAPHDPLHWPPGSENRIPLDKISLPKNFREQPPFDHGNLRGRDEIIVPAPRRPDDVRRERAVYYAIVEHLDKQVGKLLNAIEESTAPSNWLIIFTSDQGLALGSHGLMGKQNQYEHTVNTPLIIAGPHIPHAQKVQAQCALRDLYPTVCEINGLPIPTSVHGKSLQPVLSGESNQTTNTVFGYYTDTQRMCRTSDGWKLIWYPKVNRVQLFHVESDPDELRDLSADGSQAKRRDQMLSDLKWWLTDHGDPVVTSLK